MLDPDGKPSRPHLKRKKKINGEDETPKLAATFALPPMESLQNGKKMVVQPIFLIVPAPDVASVVESIAESLGNKNEVAIRTCAAGTMVTRISSTDSPRLDNNSPNLNNLRSLLDGPYSYNHPSTSTICENGQVMQNQNDQQSNYYYPENAREERGTAMDQILDDCNMYCTYDQYDMNSVGDMKPNIRPTTADFGNNYVSEGPQTRNFGTTMFDWYVCSMGKDYGSEN
ncbi:unnamed protein product [Caenorhabditis auriculariae]|uniref:Uncharacterized protein n=1 Tax=Caenorhabditis auriculariae TaxID=2777116 RepID=A0A8S1HR25_9PELO|nr:unnamed protein product [Caenorhabditis auriculariae]